MARKAHRPDAPAVESASLVGDLRSEITKLAKNYNHIVIDGTVFDAREDQKAIDEMERVLKSLLRKEQPE
jgi:hypothetical protein